MPETAAVQILRPEDDGFDAARQAFNLMVDQRPHAVALPTTADEVAEIVRHAREHGLRVAPQRTGHNAAPLGDLTDTILVKTDALNEVEIDRDTRRARVGGGAQWHDLIAKASDMGLAALHGSAPDVGIAGYTLGGGLGWYGRKLGLAANSVTAVELVTGDGRFVRADRDNEPELFWALRGGGGNFGVVTALEFDLYEVGDIYAGILFFPFERASEVLHAWREWMAGVSEEVTSVGRLLQFPPIEEIPEVVRGQSFAAIQVICLMGEDEAVELLKPLRDLGPGMDTCAPVPPAALADLHMDPPMPVPYLSAHELVGELTEQALDDLLAVAGPGSGSPLLAVEVRQTGGALARSKPESGALAALPGEFLAFGVSMTPEEPIAQAVKAHLEKLTEALALHACGRYLNFVEEAQDIRDVFGDENYARLQAVKAEYDPDNVIKGNHALTTG